MVIQILRWNGTAFDVVQGGGNAPTPKPFISGVTMPRYTPMLDLSGQKNVGNLPGVALTTFVGSGDGSSVQIPAGTYTNIDFGNRFLDIRGDATFNNCRGVLVTGNTANLSGHVTILNGSPSNVVFNDCEFHNRAQKIVGASLFGRNFKANRSVFTGAVDGVNNANTGSAPLVSGGELNDCWVGDMSWWRAATGGVVHGSDTQTHNDAMQVAWDHVPKTTNKFFAIWPSEFVGTGTPGSGSDAGNPYTGAYIVDQATQNSWRAAYLNKSSRPDQSFDGISRKSSTGGSWAGIMLNRSSPTTGLNSTHDWFSGGTVAVNAVDVNLSGAIGSIHQATVWNDMTAGHSGTDSTKGTALYVRSALTYDFPTTGVDKNLWFDGTTVTPSTI